MSIKVAVVQSTPLFLDNGRSLDKMADLLKNCHRKGIQLVLFPESYLPGYPRGMAFGASVGSRSALGREMWNQYWQNSIEIGDDSFIRISKMAKDHKIYLMVGITERDTINASLYCSLLFFSPDGVLIGKHRKIKPTGTERVIWAEGDGKSLTSYPTKIGRIGGLICWENMMPTARMAIYQSGIDLYLAPTADARPSWTASMQHIACEARSFVLSANQYFRKSDYDDRWLSHLEVDLEEDICRGGSVIVSPYGEILAGPLFDEEGILEAEINLDDIIKSRMDFDPIGHYARPDLFDLRVKNQ